MNLASHAFDLRIGIQGARVCLSPLRRIAELALLLFRSSSQAGATDHVVHDEQFGYEPFWFTSPTNCVIKH